MGLQCMNCKKETSETTAKLFEAVFVCSDCFVLATRFDEKIERELKQLRVLVREKLREALITGTFQYGAIEGPKDLLKKEDLVKSLIQRQEK